MPGNINNNQKGARVMTNECRTVLRCPYCGWIYGGITGSGLIKLCRWCSQGCEKRDKPVEERLCGSEPCIVRAVLGVDPGKLHMGEPER